jgi:hypothetical protein
MTQSRVISRSLRYSLLVGAPRVGGGLPGPCEPPLEGAGEPAGGELTGGVLTGGVLTGGVLTGGLVTGGVLTGGLVTGIVPPDVGLTGPVVETGLPSPR